jgi:hypothetical protein
MKTNESPLKYRLLILLFTAAIPSAMPHDLKTLVDTQGFITVGGQKFAEFGYSGPEAIDPASIEVLPVTAGGRVGIRLVGPIVANGVVQGLSFSYSAENLQGLPSIQGIGQRYDLFAAGGPGVVEITETAWDAGFGVGQEVARSVVSSADTSDPAPEPTDADHLSIQPPLRKVWVRTEILLFPFTMMSSVGATAVEQLFDQACLLTLACPPDQAVRCSQAVSPAAQAIEELTAMGGSAESSCGTALALSHRDQESVSLCDRVVARTYTVTDSAGASVSCTQMLTRTQDSEPPTILCPADQSLTCDQSIEPSATGWATAADPCTAAPAMAYADAVLPAQCPDVPKIVVRTWTATDDCGNTATCAQRITVACSGEGGHGWRVTGSGSRQLNSFQAVCLPTPPPRFVSHHGHVGAPHSGVTPFSPNCHCIFGVWQHDRYRTQNRLVGTFRAESSGSLNPFDSLLCVSLSNNHTPDLRATREASGSFPHQIRPTKPPREPANKICFSGIGNYTFADAKRTVPAVFRVDIEDRSLDLGHGRTVPADWYRLRLWLLDSTCGRSFTPASTAGMALRWAASADSAKIAHRATTEDLKDPVVAGPPDIDDGNLVVQGAHWIHPQPDFLCP